MRAPYERVSRVLIEFRSELEKIFEIDRIDRKTSVPHNSSPYNRGIDNSPKCRETDQRVPMDKSDNCTQASIHVAVYSSPQSNEEQTLFHFWLWQTHNFIVFQTSVSNPSERMWPGENVLSFLEERQCMRLFSSLTKWSVHSIHSFSYQHITAGSWKLWTKLPQQNGFRLPTTVKNREISTVQSFGTTAQAKKIGYQTETGTLPTVIQSALREQTGLYRHHPDYTGINSTFWV
jgi:hypothetical protein